VPGALEKLKAALGAKVRDKLVPDTEVKVTILPGLPPFVASPGGRTLVEQHRAIYAEINRKLAIEEMIGGATDAASRNGKAIVVEDFGLPSFGYHTRDEYIDTRSIASRLYLMTRLLMELGKARSHPRTASLMRVAVRSGRPMPVDWPVRSR
jgi:glutamate carboxypeptidase